MDYENMFEVPTKDCNSSCTKISEDESCKSSDYRYPTMKLFPLLLDTTVDYLNLQVSPSSYLKEMSYSSEDRWKDLTRELRHAQYLPEYPSLVYLKVSPCVILFQNSPLHTTTTLTLSVTNISLVIRNLRMMCDDHPFIKVKYKESSERKLAAGITVKFSVEYSPTQYADYFHKIVFFSDDDSFIVPIIALCPRPMLDLPDSIQLPLTPVKVESKKTLMIRNITSCLAVANFISIRPFRVEPDKICIGPDEVATVSVIFCSRYLGISKSTITVVFESGDEVVMNVEGSSECGNVYLSCARVDIPKTYMQLKRQGSVSIHNSTNCVVSFQWHLFKSEEDDHLILNKLKSLYQEFEEVEKKKVAKLVEFDVYDEDVHQVICERITRDNINLATVDSLYFNHQNFRIFPLRGEVWPGGVCNCTVVFSSKNIGKFETFTFLEIDGLESRIPLCLSASAIGPNIRLNVDSILAGEIHLLQVFSAQVIVENKGDIVGNVCFVCQPTKCGSTTTVSCSPLYYKLEPGQTRPYLISISRSSIGPFSEQVTFQIDESRIYLNCLIKGVIVEPPLEFSEKLIDFRAVPLGFELVKPIKLINKCSQGFGFMLEITGYWEEEAVKAWDRVNVPSHPKEYSVFPSDGFIKPFEQLELKVVGLLNQPCKERSSLRLSVWDNKIERLTLPIRYSVSRIEVHSLTPNLFINFAFIDYTYHEEIDIVNDTGGTAFYTLFIEDSNNGTKCDIEENDGVILPYAHKTLHVSLKVLFPGMQRTRIMLKTFGSDYRVPICQVKMNGIHPVLNLEPMEQLDFGEVLLLIPTKKSFSIANVSPISTEYVVTFEKESSDWRLGKESGVIQGNCKEDIEVMLTLNDPGSFENTIIVTSPGSALHLKVIAQGIGCAVITAPGLCPSLNLGNLISSIVHEIDVLIINKSSTVHEILWSTCENLNNWTKTLTDENQGDYFKIIPYRMTLKPGQEEKLKLTAYCEEEKRVEESYYCVGVSGARATYQSSNCRKTIGESLIFASFIHPRIKISKNEINFCVRVAPDEQFPSYPTETVTVTPEFTQAIVLEARVKPPFKMVDKDGMLLEHISVNVINASPFELTIMFDTAFRTDCYSWSADASLLFTFKNHPSRSILPLHGEVQYPNIVLNLHKIDFGGIYKYSEAYRQILMKNMSPYDVHYSWEWSEHLIRPIFTPIENSKEKMEGGKTSISEDVCIEQATKTKSKSIESKALSYGPSQDMAIPEEQPDFHSVIQEFLNIIVLHGPLPEDCDLNEEERIALRGIASLLLNDKILFEKFTFLMLSKEASTIISEPLLSLSPLRFNQIYQNLQKLQDMVINDELLNSFQNAVIPFINKYVEKEMFEPLTPVMPVLPHDIRPSISKLIDFTPKWGILRSGQEQVIGCSFIPNEEVEVDAVALCKIYGGPSEKVCIRGICGQTKYSISRLIDFGFIPFCEITSKEWKVSNNCCIGIVLRVIKKSEVISIEPTDCYLYPNSEFCFRVMCLPGIPGPVESHFFLEIGTLEVAKIEVKGMAVMSQIMLDLPQNEIDMPKELFYRGIASITDPVFTNPLFRRPTSSSTSVSKLHETSLTSQQLLSPKIVEPHGFHLIDSSNDEDEVPSLIEIRMACERQQMIACMEGEAIQIKHHASSKSLKNKYFKDCLLAPYHLEFGSVIFDTEVVKIVQVYNYGYLNAKVCLCLPGNEDDLENQGITFKWTDLCNIAPGSVGFFTITLHPSTDFYTGCFYNVKLNFVLEVACGAIIPLEMTAYFVQPEISMKNLLEFGEIKCGHTSFLPLTLYNIGTVDAKWTIILREVKRNQNDSSAASYFDSVACPFYSDKDSGLISPGQSDTIIIQFLPYTNGIYERVLELVLNESRASPRCKLRGSVIEPFIYVNQTVIDFGTVLPYSSIYELDLTVYNPCPFPVQVSLLDYDSEMEVENRVLRALCLYYKTERMQLSLKYFDVEMSPQVKQVYNSMVRLGAYLKLSKVHTVDSAPSDEEVVARKGSKVKIATPVKSSARGASAKKGRKKSKGSKKSTSSSIDEKPDLDLYLLNKTIQEKDELVQDYIEWIQNISENDQLDLELMEKMTLKFDVLEMTEEDESWKQFLTSDKSFSMVQPEPVPKGPLRKGTLIIFHGAPYTDYNYLANKTARYLCLKPVTLDSIIMEEAAYSNGPASLVVRKHISNAYDAAVAAKEAEQAKLDAELTKYNQQTSTSMETVKSIETVSSVGSVHTAGEEKPESDIIIDALEDLEMKVTFILDHRAEEARKKAEEAAAQEALAISTKRKSIKKSKEKSSKSGKNSSSKSTKGSSKVSKKDQTDDIQSPTFLDIGFDVIHELIAHRIKLEIFDNGILVDSLTGLFIKHPVKCLEMLLSIAGPTKNLFFVNVFHSYEKMNILRENQRRKEELRLLQNSENIASRLKMGSVDESIAKLSRKDCFQALDLKHNTAVKIRDDLILEKLKLAAEKLAMEEAEQAKTVSSAPKKSGKSKKGKSTAKTDSDMKGKKKKKVQPEPEELIPPEEIEMMDQFNSYSAHLDIMINLLEGHDRLKSEGIIDKKGSSKRHSATIKLTARKTSRSRIRASVGSLASRQSSRDKTVITKDQQISRSTVAFSQAEEISQNIGVPIIVINNANISTQLKFFSQISGLKTVIPINRLRSSSKVSNKGLIEYDKNNEYFWYDKPDLLQVVKPSNIFRLENRCLPPELCVKTNVSLPKVKPQTSIPSAKDLKPIVQLVRAVSPINSFPYLSLDRRVSYKMFSKKNPRDIENDQLITRKTLDMGASISWTINFYPEEVGRFKHDINIGITSWSKYCKVVRVEGTVILPDLVRKPQSIFPLVVEKVEKVSKDPCFIIEKNVFDFGLIFCYIDSLNKNKSVITKFKLINPLKLTAHVNLSLNLGTHFDVEPCSMVVKAGETKWLLVECNPRVEGFLEDQLICSIQNNPEPFIIQLCCTAVIGKMAVSPKEILFNQVLIRHLTMKTLVLSNVCGLPLVWSFKPFDDISKSLTCSMTSGFIEPFSKTLLHFTFKAVEVEVIDKSITLEVHDKKPEDGGVVIQSISFPVKAESYDVVVTLCFPEAVAGSKELNFGDIKVEAKHTRYFQLENRGNYNIEFRIQFEDFPLDSPYAPSDIFKLSVMEGLLHPKAKQPTKIYVTVNCLDEIVLDQVSLIKVILFERENYVANLSVPVSLSSHYTKFRLVPKDEVGFGSVLVGETKVLFLTLENTGIFEFKYLIISKVELDNIIETQTKDDSSNQEEMIGNKSESRGPDSWNFSKSPDLKIKKHSDRKHMGPFTIHGVSGTVKQDSSVKIRITCSPNREANFKEVLLVQASEMPDAIRYGIPVNLLATGCLPNIDFTNASLMYKDAIIVSDPNTLQEKHGLPMVIYNEESGLMFQNVVVSKSKSLKIYLQNIGMVSSTVNIRIQLIGSVRAEYFLVEPQTLYIATYATESFNVEFSPTSIELSETVLEMELEVPNSKPVIHTVSLSGRGCVPIVELISPIQVKSCVKSDKSVIDMGTCLFNFHLSNILTFKNPGTCYCKFILELTTVLDKNYFSLAPLPHCKDLVKSLDNQGNERLSCGLGPDGEVQLSCVFAPTDVTACISTIQILIVDNPYEHYKINLYGKGYMDSVTIEGLPFLFEPFNLSHLNLKTGKSGKGGSGNVNSSYLLDFGQSYVDRPVKQEFVLRNHSSNWVRFTWDLTQQGVSFYPRVGCIPPTSAMAVYSVLISNTPTRPTKIPVKCNLEKVELSDPCAAWNSHEKLVAWLRHEDKYLQRYDIYCNIGTNNDEPHYLEVAKQGELKLQVQLETDIPLIQPDASQIFFPDTLICQGNSEIVTIMNVSRVEARVKCNIVIMKSVPSNYEATAVFSCGKLLNNELYPNTGRYDNDSSTLSSSIKSKPVKGKKCGSESSESSDSRVLVKAKNSCPFTVAQENLILRPGKTEEIKIYFKPMQMFTYSAKLVFLLDGVKENWPSVDLLATGLTSYCHLEIDNVDVDMATLQNYPHGTKIIFMECIGLPASYVKKFSVINPTDSNYNFEWIKCERDEVEGAVNEQVCATPNGLILAHKSYDMEFNFLSVDEGRFEKIWLLRIIEMEMEQHLLFITEVREPCVKVSSPSLNLRPTVAGMSVVGETRLLNEENIEIKFKIDKCSLFSEGRYEKLEIDPLSGVIAPQSFLPLRVSFNAKRAGDTIFTVGIHLAKKKEPILLKVATYCFSVEADITVCPEGATHLLQLVSDKKNHINIGHMELKVPRRLELNIRNSGKAGFYVELFKRDQQNMWKKSCLLFEHETKTDFISPGSSTTLFLTFSATVKSSFNNLPFIIKIVKGPEYEILFSGDASAPEYTFSFTNYDFGPRFVQTSEENYNTVELIFRNEDEISLEIEKLFKDTEIFKVELNYCVVPPRSTLMILIKFYPKQIISYSSQMEFLINGLYSTIIQLTGTGVPLRVELVRPKDKLIDFGPILTGQTVCRTIEVINKSGRTAAIRLVTRETSRENYQINVKPKELTLSVDRVHKFNIIYTPIKRAINMTEKIWFECEEHSEVLVVIEGKGVAAELKLDRDMIPFGLVVIGSSSTVKFALVNSGDFGARFVWDFSKASDCFKISLKEGYSTPGSTLTFDITFTPKSSTPRAVRNQVFCNVENWKAPLSLVLSGSSADVPPAKEFIRFVSPVRQKTTKSIPIRNNSSEKWVIHPTVSGECFFGESMLTILPRSICQYNISYYPTTMSAKNSNHEGSLFFSYPDGQNTLFGLRGQANPPNCEEPIFWTVPAKKEFVGQIPIRNWLPESQRFTVQISSQGEGMKQVNKSLYKIFGNAQIEVPPLTTRLYDVHFFSYLSTNLKFIVSYTNEVDGEYGWFELSVTVGEAEVLETYNLETEVRKQIDLNIMFNNPTDTKQILNSDSDLPNIVINTPLTLPPKLTGELVVSYFPIVEEEGRIEKLVIKSPGLGVFYYYLVLRAKPPSLPSPVNLTASLGRSQNHTFMVTNYTLADVSFRVQVNTNSLICPKVVKVKPMISESIIIIYEPFAETIENVVLTASSENAGTFKFPLCLTGTAPAPRGPFQIRPGTTLSLSFKNIFLETKEFIMSSESAFFIIKNAKKTLKSKQEAEFVVQMMKKEEILKGNKLNWPEYPIASKLIVSPADPSLSHLCWLYYIKSEPVKPKLISK